jgi:hypothetical protein
MTQTLPVLCPRRYESPGGDTFGAPFLKFQRRLSWTSTGGDPPSLGIYGDSDGRRSWESDFTLGKIFDYSVSIYLPTACSDQQIAIFPAGKRWIFCSGQPACNPPGFYFSLGYNCAGNNFVFRHPTAPGAVPGLNAPQQSKWYTLKLRYRPDFNYVDASVYNGRPPGALTSFEGFAAQGFPVNWNLAQPVRIGFGADWDVDAVNPNPFARFYHLSLQST